jgi:hypothetical protein
MQSHLASIGYNSVEESQKNKLKYLEAPSWERLKNTSPRLSFQNAVCIP